MLIIFFNCAIASIATMRVTQAVCAKIVGNLGYNIVQPGFQWAVLAKLDEINSTNLRK